MKKLFLFGFTIINSLYLLNAQIYTPSSTIQGSSGNNNVGIGTSTPVGKLHISLPTWSNWDIDSQHAIFGSGTYGHGVRIGYNESSNYGIINVLKPGIAFGNLILQYSGGNVGIGTSAPYSKLDVYGNIGITTGTWYGAYYSGQPTHLRGMLGMYNHQYTIVKSIDNDSGDGIQFQSYTGGALLTILDSGNIGIGTPNPGNYKLNVAGSIRANEVVVNTSGADFVFGPDYKLRSLPEVERFIKENNHLPDLQSATEMQEIGMNVSEMQTKLLQKIEELTMYVIELKKENEYFKKEVDKLKKKINE